MVSVFKGGGVRIGGHSVCEGGWPLMGEAYPSSPGNGWAAVGAGRHLGVRVGLWHPHKDHAASLGRSCSVHGLSWAW